MSNTTNTQYDNTNSGALFLNQDADLNPYWGGPFNLGENRRNCQMIMEDNNLMFIQDDEMIGSLEIEPVNVKPSENGGHLKAKATGTVGSVALDLRIWMQTRKADSKTETIFQVKPNTRRIVEASDTDIPAWAQ